MNNDEKEVKKSKPRKTASKKAKTTKTTKVSEKTKSQKKTTEEVNDSKKDLKKVEKKVSSKPKEDALPVKEVKKEVKSKVKKASLVKDKKVIVLEDEKADKVVTADNKNNDKNEINLIKSLIIMIILFIVLLLLFNRSFLKTNYSNDSIELNLPRFSYYINDNGKEVKFVTLRKSSYLNDFYNEYLEGFTFYSCYNGTKTFYYNEDTDTLIYNVDVKKVLGIKIITVKYENSVPGTVCNMR